MAEWMGSTVSAEYSLSSDWDDRWRTGGSLEEILEEAHLSPDYILDGIERFVRERETRMERICQGVEEARSR